MLPRRIFETDTKAQEEILALLRASFAYMDGRINPPSSLHALTAAGIAQHAKMHEIWVLGDPIVACVFLSEQEDALYLGKLAVNDGHRGQGLAQRLVTLADQRAQALYFDRLELQVRIELTENQAAFAKMGFVKTATGSHPGFDHPTEITMQRPVNFAGN